MSGKDYFESGSWNIACSMCGKKLKSNEVEKNWQGMYRCHECNEIRHPQDFVTATQDKQTVPFSQPQRDLDVFFCDYNGQSAVPGYSVPGCMIPGRGNLLDEIVDSPIIPIPVPPPPPPPLPLFTADSTLITADDTLHTADEG